MELKHLIISGDAGHGKDTLADYLVREYGYTRVGYMDAMRREVSDRYRNAPAPVTPDYLTHDAVKEIPDPRLALMWCSDEQFVAVALACFEEEDAAAGLHGAAQRMTAPRSPRRIQQCYGTEYRCEQDKLYWVKLAKPVLDNATTPLVISDGRKPWEIDYGEQIGARRLHVIRPGFRKVSKSHASEVTVPLSPTTIVIMNDAVVTDEATARASLKQFYSRIDDVMLLQLGIQRPLQALSRQSRCAV